MSKQSSIKAAGRPTAKPASKPKSHSKAPPAKAVASARVARRADPAFLGAWVVDASLEHVPHLDPHHEYKPGTRNLHLDIRFGASQIQPNKHIVQSIQIKSMIEISATHKPLIVAEITCIGIFDPQHFPTFKDDSAQVFHMAQCLWPLARQRMSALLAFSGQQTPPLPENMPQQT